MTVDDLELLRLEDLDQVAELVHLYEEIDVPREHVMFFRQHLLERGDSWFVQVGDVGLVYLTSIIPSFSANFQVVFWDKKLGKDRRELMQRIIATAFEEFALTRIQALVPVVNVTLVETTFPKVGFVKEGVMRKAWREKGEDVDMVVFSLLASEVSECLPVEHLKTTSLALAI